MWRVALTVAVVHVLCFVHDNILIRLTHYGIWGAKNVSSALGTMGVALINWSEEWLDDNG